jgi:ATP-binding cassette subfamily C protein CydD
MRFNKHLLSEALQARGLLLGTIGLGSTAGVLLVVQARLLARAVDDVFLQGRLLTEVTPLLWGLLAVIAARALTTTGGQIAAGRLAIRIKHDLRMRLAEHLLALGPSYTGGERTGELTTTLTEGVEALDATFRQYLPRLALAAIVPAAILLAVFPIDPLSGVVLLLTGPLIPLFMILIGNLAKGVSQQQWGTLSRLSAHFLDVVQGLPTLKLFGRSKEQIATIGVVSERFRQTTMGVLRVAFISALALEMLGTISTAIVAVEVGLRLLAGRIVFEQALFVLVLAPEFYLPMRALGTSFHAAAEGADAAERIFAILHTQPAISTPDAVTREGRGEIYLAPPVRLPHEQPTPHPFDLSRDVIRFTQVASYPGERRALDGVTFSLAPGETVALVGPSGAGKSTVAHLLLRFLEPDAGQIAIGDTPLTAIPLADWRRGIVWVPQAPALFAGSVADNVRLGRPNAPEEDVIRAAQLADLHDTIAALPQGYQTPIGEGGARLSRGQAQRLALARAFLVDAPLVILDEATTHLDPVQQTRLTETIDRLTADRTALVIAHHLATVERADRVLVLDAGRIVEEGAPHDLRRRGGPFAGLIAAAEETR